MYIFCSDAATTLTYEFVIPSFSSPGVHGFSVGFFNGISDVKWDYNTKEPNFERISLLDPSPMGSGEWVTVDVLMWDANWVGKNAVSKCIRYVHVQNMK